MLSYVIMCYHVLSTFISLIVGFGNQVHGRTQEKPVWSEKTLSSSVRPDRYRETKYLCKGNPLEAPFSWLKNWYHTSVLGSWNSHWLQRYRRAAHSCNGQYSAIAGGSGVKPSHLQWGNRCSWPIAGFLCKIPSIWLLAKHLIPSSSSKLFRRYSPIPIFFPTYLSNPAVLSKKLRVLLPSFCATWEGTNLDSWLLRNKPDGPKKGNTKKTPVSHVLSRQLLLKGLFMVDIWLSIFHPNIPQPWVPARRWRPTMSAWPAQKVSPHGANDVTQEVVVSGLGVDFSPRKILR